MNEVTLVAAENTKLCVKYLYKVDGYHTMRFIVESQGFKGASNFCISNVDLIEVLTKTESVLKELRGSVEISDQDSDAHIMMTMTRFGHLIVNGQIGGSCDDHSLKFTFDSDQTVLDKLRSFLKENVE
ncbi:hypothetical protein [Pontibacillus salipaludis]|uniref:Uncharacterized protein n=1 Tax=Pontibacillus salipaludis TaxID=1697394 RepID=A0ABQ1Q628_9BACI|nr:hypothetical protein [Pontibacillus salipaludis]GGD14354.1 hypothetical protein GCM10011389_22490 [Pontibacillus salipaludis]